jgi:predicted peptidase
MRFIVLIFLLFSVFAADDIQTHFAPVTAPALIAQNPALFRLYRPPHQAQSKLPLILLLHGSSGRGSDNMGQFTTQNKLAISWLWQQKEQPCYILVPQCPAGFQWTPVNYNPTQHTQSDDMGDVMRSVLHTITYLKTNEPIDAQRIYVIGNSLGGYGTWDIIARAPTTFAAAIPICGGADLKTIPLIQQTPLWIFHGAHDQVVTVEHARRIVHALKSVGISPHYSEFAEGGHDIGHLIYQTDGLATWLFHQRRK